MLKCLTSVNVNVNLQYECVLFVLRIRIAGAEGEHGLLTYELCYQSHGAVRAHLERFIDAHRAALPASVYISTDNDSMQFFVKHIFEEVHVRYACACALFHYNEECLRNEYK